MKTNASLFRALPRLAILGALFGAAACARGARPPENPPTERPSLHLAIDRQPIDRNAADRVSYAPVIEKTAASVVFVYSTKQVSAQNAAPFLQDPLFRRFFGGSDGPGRMPDQTEHGLGSGVVISADGYILTNNHVVDGADDVKVSIGESPRRYDATVVGTDALADVAVLKIEAQGLVPATLADSDQLRVGDVVLAIGDPFGLGQSVSRGIVSAVGRGNLGIEAVEDFIQTDAAINPGNSGGALIDSAGRVVGLNTAILSGSGGFAGVGFAIPINLVRNVAEQIVNTGKVDRGFLGVAPQMLTPELGEQFGSYAGALVAEVTPGGPADQAGLQAGDVITAINGVAVRDPGQLLLTVSQLRPDTSVDVAYMRNGQKKTATARLGRRPEEALASGDANRQGGRSGDQDGVLDGVFVGDLTPQIRDQLQIPARVQGAIITQVDPSSASAREGLREGDVILELDRHPVKNAQEAVRLSEEIKGPKVVARIWRAGQSRFMIIDEAG
jgi:serine protease Do